MEALIAKYPDDFFPRRNLTLVGTQGSFRGIGRYDIMFKDNYDTNIIMELKAVPAKYENATQLAKYKDALEERGESNVLMWLVATVIPKSVAEFLDRIGIEHTEIHEAEYRQVVKRRNIKIESDLVDLSLGDEYSLADQGSVKKSKIISTETGKARFRNALKPIYKVNKERLKSSFPSAYEFLTYPEHYREAGLWISTSSNSHLYYNDGFLMYIILGHNNITLSPKFNGRIHTLTSVKSDLIFPRIFNQIIPKLKGVEEKWAMINDNTLTLNHNTPQLFFNTLLEEIFELKW